MKHRKEEDDLYRKFARQREEEEFKFKEEFRVSFQLLIFVVVVVATAYLPRMMEKLLKWGEIKYNLLPVASLSRLHNG